MIWLIIVFTILFIALKWAITWLIENKSVNMASWTIFLIVFVFSGFWIIYAKIKRDKVEKMAALALEAQVEARVNAEEAQANAMEAMKAMEMAQRAQEEVENFMIEAQAQIRECQGKK